MNNAIAATSFNKSLVSDTFGDQQPSLFNDISFSDIGSYLRSYECEGGDDPFPCAEDAIVVSDDQEAQVAKYKISLLEDGSDNFDINFDVIPETNCLKSTAMMFIVAGSWLRGAGGSIAVGVSNMITRCIGSESTQQRDNHYNSSAGSQYNRLQSSSDFSLTL